MTTELKISLIFHNEVITDINTMKQYCPEVSGLSSGLFSLQSKNISVFDVLKTGHKRLFL